MISKDTIDRIFDTARIEEVVGDFVTLKKRGVGALARIGTPAAQTVLANAAKTGDRLLRKIAAAHR